MFKAQILAELVKQYPGLDKKFLGTIADKLATKVTEEAKIEGAVSELNTGMITITDLAAEFQKEGDRRATDAVETHKKKFPVKDDSPNPNPPTPPTPGDNSEFVKTLKAMQDKLDAMEREKKAQTGKESLIEKLKEAKIPERLAKRISVSDDTDIDALVAELKTEHEAELQEYTTSGFRQNSFQPGGGGNGGPTTSNIADAIKKHAAAEVAKATPVKKT
jgi:hypothetical protein